MGRAQNSSDSSSDSSDDDGKKKAKDGRSLAVNGIIVVVRLDTLLGTDLKRTRINRIVS